MNINALIDKYGINATAARVYIQINNLVTASKIRGKLDKRGIPFCFASQKKIGEMLKISERTVSRAINQLKKAGLVTCKRTPGNGRLYTAQAAVGESQTAKNGGSIEDIKNNIYNHISISPSNKRNSMERPLKASTMTPCAPDQGQRQQERPAQHPQPVRGQQTAHTPGKGRPTPKRPPIDYAARKAAKERYEDDLRDRLDLYAFAYTMPEFEQERRRNEAFVRYVANVMTSENEYITIKGGTYSKAEFWNTMRNIDGYRLNCAFERMRQREKQTAICNPAAYLAACAFCEIEYSGGATL